MTTIPSLQLDPIKYLVNKKYPANTLSKGGILLASDDSLEVYNRDQEKVKQINEQAKVYAEELKDKSAEELDGLVRLEQIEEEKAREEKRFYNRPEAKADFGYWAKMPFWTLGECAALLCEKNPRVVIVTHISKLNISETNAPKCRPITPFIEHLLGITVLIDRAKKAGELQEPCKPMDLLNWAKVKSIDIPEELQKAVDASGELVDWRNQYDELRESADNEISALKQKIAEQEALISQLEKEHTTLKEKPREEKAGPLTTRLRSACKVIAIMAIKKYQYNFYKHNSTATNIIRAFEVLGLKIDDQTVLGLIRDGYQLLKEQNPRLEELLSEVK